MNFGTTHFDGELLLPRGVSPPFTKDIQQAITV
jgi:hypothetical protein